MQRTTMRSLFAGLMSSLFAPFRALFGRKKAAPLRYWAAARRRTFTWSSDTRRDEAVGYLRDRHRPATAKRCDFAKEKRRRKIARASRKFNRRAA